jgi:hypothetical protein
MEAKKGYSRGRFYYFYMLEYSLAMVAHFDYLKALQKASYDIQETSQELQNASYDIQETSQELLTQLTQLALLAILAKLAILALLAKLVLLAILAKLVLLEILAILEILVTYQETSLVMKSSFYFLFQALTIFF